MYVTITLILLEVARIQTFAQRIPYLYIFEGKSNIILLRNIEYLMKISSRNHSYTYQNLSREQTELHVPLSGHMCMIFTRD